MSQSDLYAPPKAAVTGPTPAELHAKASGELALASIGQRIGGSLLDFVVFLPVLGLQTYLNTVGRGASMAMIVVYQIVVVFMYVVMVHRFGGNPGKLMLGTRVVMADGTPVSWKAALLRYAVYGAAALLGGVAQILAIMAMSDDSYVALGFLGRSTEMAAKMPAWAMPLNFIMMAWFLGSFISLLATKRRRTLCDFMAGTIVVRTR